MDGAVIKTDRAAGWLSAAAVFGVVSALMPQLAARTLGWLGAVLGLLPALLLPRWTPAPRWARWLRWARCLWSVPAIALSLRILGEGLSLYTYQERWNAWGPMALVLLMAWRGSLLSRQGLERLGKLIVWLLGAMAFFLGLLLAPRVWLPNLALGSGEDLLGGLGAGLLTAGAASALVAPQGRRPMLVTTGVSALTVGLTTGAEGAALAAMLAHPFLALCNAAMFNVRLCALGASVWTVSQVALMVLLLSRFPGKGGSRAAVCLVCYALALWMPWSEIGELALLGVGAVLGYGPALYGLLCHRVGKSARKSEKKSK